MSAVTTPPPPLGDAASAGEPSPGFATSTPPAEATEALPGGVSPHLGRVAADLDPRYADLREPVGFLAAPFARQTWREFGYLWLSLFVAPFAFTYVMFTVSFTAGILVTVVGLVVTGGLVHGARGGGRQYSSNARSKL